MRFTTFVPSKKEVTKLQREYLLPLTASCTMVVNTKRSRRFKIYSFNKPVNDLPQSIKFNLQKLPDTKKTSRGIIIVAQRKIILKTLELTTSTFCCLVPSGDEDGITFTNSLLREETDLRFEEFVQSLGSPLSTYDDSDRLFRRLLEYEFFCTWKPS